LKKNPFRGVIILVKTGLILVYQDETSDGVPEGRRKRRTAKATVVLVDENGLFGRAGRLG